MYRFTNSEGMSLIEVIVATCFIGILIIPITGLLNINIKYNAKARQQIIATSLAENEIEKLRSNLIIKEGMDAKQYSGFTISSVVEALDKDELDKKINIYKIKVEVKKQGKIIESIETYKNSIKEDTEDE